MKIESLVGNISTSLNCSLPIFFRGSYWMNKKEISINNKQLKVRWCKKKKRQKIKIFINLYAHRLTSTAIWSKNEPVQNPFYSSFPIPILTFSILFPFLHLFFIRITRVMWWLRGFFLTFDDYSFFSLHHRLCSCTIAASDVHLARVPVFTYEKKSGMKNWKTKKRKMNIITMRD